MEIKKVQPFFSNTIYVVVLLFVSVTTNRGGKRLPCETLTVSHRCDQLHAHVHTALKISEAPLRALAKSANYIAPQAHAQDSIPENDLATLQQSTNWRGVRGGQMMPIMPRGLKRQGERQRGDDEQSQSE